MKILFVDDETQILQGLTRLVECEVDDWEIETAQSGHEALEILNEEDFNVIVSDMRMPEMDGAQLLEEVEKQFPDILRVILSGQADRESVMKAINPMHQYLSKPCDSQHLIEVIRKAEVFQNTISSTEVLRTIGQANCLPSLPAIVLEINQELESEDWTSTTLAEIVSKDPLLCAKILKLANSPIFGARTAIVDIERALSFLGSEMMRAIALSLSVFTTDNQTAAHTQNLFGHCFEIAGISKSIARWEGTSAKISMTAFTGGLLHDVGKVILFNAFENQYTELIEQATELDCSLSELEMKEFGASHAGIGAYLLETWGLPVEIIETVATHHRPTSCKSLESKIVFAANWLAQGGDEKILSQLDTEEHSDFLAQLKTWRSKYTKEMEEN